MSDLIERLERATGPEFALDCAIFETVLPEEWFGSKVISWFSHGGKYGCNTEDGYRHLECLTAPAYSASLDAALTLVPEGYSFSISMSVYYGAWNALYTDPDDAVYEATCWKVIRAHSKRSLMYGHHLVPALALCIAALKAREAAK